MNPSRPPADHVSVCVCTYRRNELLERLLRNLARQNTAGRFSYSIVVVDNDADGHAQDTVRQIGAELSIDLTYAIERERTIPAVRNHALRLARGNYIGIIDDDEFPPPNWLLTMYDGIQTFGVDGSLGPVHPFFDAGAPAWLAKSGLCELSSFRTGTMCFTGEPDPHGKRAPQAQRLRRSRFAVRSELPDRRVGPGVLQAGDGARVPVRRRGVGAGVRGRASRQVGSWVNWVRRAFVNGFNAKVYADRAIGPVRRVFLTLKAVAGAVSCPGAPGVRAAGTAPSTCLEKGAYHLSRACASFGIELWKKRDF